MVDPGWPILCSNLTRLQDAQMTGKAFTMSVCIWEETSREIGLVIGMAEKIHSHHLVWLPSKQARG